MRLIHLLMVSALLPGGPEQGALRGTVRTEGSLEPVPYATVRVPALNRTVLTDQHGFYVLADLPPGRWRVEATALSHDTVSVTIVAAERGSIRLDFDLPLRPVALGRVEARTGASITPLTEDLPTTMPGPPAVRLQGPALRNMPGLAEADVLRALQVLPSVSATSDFSSALYVRGGSSDQTLITIDGIPLFNPYHVGGIFSAVAAEAVSSVEVWPGAMPAGAGDRLSGAVDIRTRDGGRDRHRSTGSLGLISASLGMDGPLPGGRGSYLLTGRRTYLDAVSDVAHALGLIPVTMPYGFSDMYGKLSHEVGRSGNVTLSGYLDLEDIHFPASMANEVDADADFDWGSRMLAATFRQPLGSELLLEARAGYTEFRGSFHGWTLRPEYPNRPLQPGEEEGLPVDTTKTIEGASIIRDLLGAVELTWYGRSHTARIGAQLDAYLLESHLDRLDEVDPRYFPAFRRSDRPRTIALFVEDEWRPLERLELRAGVRYLDAGDAGSAWLPRFGARLALTPRLDLNVGGGAYAQVLRSIKDEESIAASFLAYDILAAQPAGVGLSTARDLVVGGEWRGARTRVRADVFVKRMRNLMTPPPPENPLLSPPLPVDSFRVGEGRARGVELLASRRLGEAELTASYTLLDAEREVDGERYTPRFERRHMLDLNLGMPAGDDGLFTARLALASGQPYTPTGGHARPYIYEPWLGTWADVGGQALLGERNSARLPGYMRLDVAYRNSFERRWFGRDITFTPYVQVVNALNNKNVLIGAPDAGSELKVNYWPQLPILPTLGVEWRF